MSDSKKIAKTKQRAKNSVKFRELSELKGACLGCRKCAIGGKTISGKEWTGEVNADGETDNITNVFSSMKFPVKVMVVGQNPGADEVARGVPFIGPAGKVFDKALSEIVGLTREDVYVTNVVKCYTPYNRKPTKSEVEHCRDFLDREVALVQPVVLVALGSYAFQALTGFTGIMRYSGKVVASTRYRVPVVAMLHPSPYNTNNPERRVMFENGMNTLAKCLKDWDG